MTIDSIQESDVIPAGAGRRTMRRLGPLAAGCLLLVACPGVMGAGDGLARLRTADASCATGGPARFVDCGNGTVADNQTGLVWLANALCLHEGVDWSTAMKVVAGLADFADGPKCGLNDNSSPGEWRLPTVAEWEALVRDAVLLGCDPAITDDAGTGCWSDPCNSNGGCSFYHVQSLAYWSATTSVDNPTTSWEMFLGDGVPGVESKLIALRFWPVRGGR